MPTNAVVGRRTKRQKLIELASARGALTPIAAAPPRSELRWGRRTAAIIAIPIGLGCERPSAPLTAAPTSFTEHRAWHVTPGERVIGASALDSGWLVLLRSGVALVQPNTDTMRILPFSDTMIVAASYQPDATIEILTGIPPLVKKYSLAGELLSEFPLPFTPQAADRTACGWIIGAVEPSVIRIGLVAPGGRAIWDRRHVVRHADRFPSESLWISAADSAVLLTSSSLPNEIIRVHCNGAQERVSIFPPATWEQLRSVPLKAVSIEGSILFVVADMDSDKRLIARITSTSRISYTNFRGSFGLLAAREKPPAFLVLRRIDDYEVVEYIPERLDGGGQDAGVRSPQ